MTYRLCEECFRRPQEGLWEYTIIPISTEDCACCGVTCGHGVGHVTSEGCVEAAKRALEETK